MSVFVPDIFKVCDKKKRYIICSTFNIPRGRPGFTGKYREPVSK